MNKKRPVVMIQLGTPNPDYYGQLYIWQGDTCILKKQIKECLDLPGFCYVNEKRGNLQEYITPKELVFQGENGVYYSIKYYGRIDHLNELFNINGNFIHISPEFLDNLYE